MTTAVNNSTTPSQALLDSVNGKSNTSKSTAAEAQDRFMTLLVTQMKNQDPLNPLDNAQVTSQLAQLSTVTGIDKLNTTLESLISNVQTGQSYQASSMIGHDVLVSGNQISATDKEGGYYGVELPTGADKMTVTIKDSAGATIRTLSLGKQDAGVTPMVWDGLNDAGEKVAAGNYKFEVAATTGTDVVNANPLSYAQVLSISNNAGGIKLNLSNLATVSTTDVKEIF